MKSKYCIYGASGHGKVVIEILEALGYLIEGLYDDDPKKVKLFDYEVSNDKSVFNLPDITWMIGIGNNEIRKKIAETHNLTYGNAIDPSAQISKRNKIGSGVVIMPGVTINSSTIIGDHSIINTNSSVDHDCVIAEYVHVSPNASLCGGVQVGQGTHIGAGATIIPGIIIGKWVTVGAGSVIIECVPDYATIVGNPGKIIKLPK